MKKIKLLNKIKDFLSKNNKKIKIGLFSSLAVGITAFTITNSISNVNASSGINVDNGYRNFTMYASNYTEKKYIKKLNEEDTKFYNLANNNEVYTQNTDVTIHNSTDYEKLTDSDIYTIQPNYKHICYFSDNYYNGNGQFMCYNTKKIFDKVPTNTYWEVSIQFRNVVSTTADSTFDEATTSLTYNEKTSYILNNSTNNNAGLSLIFYTINDDGSLNFIDGYGMLYGYRVVSYNNTQQHTFYRFFSDNLYCAFYCKPLSGIDGSDKTLTSSVQVTLIPYSYDSSFNNVNYDTDYYTSTQNQVETLYNENETNKATIESLNNQITSLNSQIDNLNSQITSLNSKVSSLKSNIEDLEDEISDQKIDIEQAQDDIKQYQEEIETLNNEIETLNNQIAQNNITINEYISEINAYKELMTTSVASSILDMTKITIYDLTGTTKYSKVYNPLTKEFEQSEQNWNEIELSTIMINYLKTNLGAIQIDNENGQIIVNVEKIVSWLTNETYLNTTDTTYVKPAKLHQYSLRIPVSYTGQLPIAYTQSISKSDNETLVKLTDGSWEYLENNNSKIYNGLQYIEFQCTSETYCNFTIQYGNVYATGYQQGVKDMTTKIVELQRQNGNLQGQIQNLEEQIAKGTSTLDALLINVGANVPMQILKSILNFEILGVNVFSLFTSITTALIMFWVIKKFFK